MRRRERKGKILKPANKEQKTQTLKSKKKKFAKKKVDKSKFRRNYASKEFLKIAK